MKTKSMSGAKASALFLKLGLDDLADAFDGHVAEVYDLGALRGAADRLSMFDEIEKKWRGKRCSVITLVLKP